MSSADLTSVPSSAQPGERTAAEARECAHLAVGYLLGWRQRALPTPQTLAGETTLARLTEGERRRRAMALSDELALITRALGERRLG